MPLPHPWVGYRCAGGIAADVPDPFRRWLRLSIIVAAVAWGSGRRRPRCSRWASLYLPALALPTLVAFWRAAANVLLPQLALT